MAGSALGFTLGHATNAILNTYTYSLAILVDGTNCVNSIFTQDATVSLALGQPAVFTARMLDTSKTPMPGMIVSIRLDGATGTVKLFSGHITSRALELRDGPTTLEPLWAFSATDYSWAMSLPNLVYGWWRSKGINTIVRDVLTRCVTYAGITPGYLPASLGTLDSYDASGKTVAAVLDELAEAAGAYWQVDANGAVSMFKTPDHLSAGALTVTNTSKNCGNLFVSLDYADIGTLGQVIGQPTTLREAAIASATSLAIQSWAPFTSESGTVIVGGVDIVSYTSGTTVPGSERLTLSSASLTRDWPEGTEVAPIVTVTDASAVTALASASGTDGDAVRSAVVSSANQATATTLATTLTDIYADGIGSVTGRVVDGTHTNATDVLPGATVTLNVTAPVTVSSSYRVQSVTLRPRRVAGVNRWERTFVASPVNRYQESFNRVMGAA